MYLLFFNDRMCDLNEAFGIKPQSSPYGSTPISELGCLNDLDNFESADFSNPMLSAELNEQLFERQMKTKEIDFKLGWGTPEEKAYYNSIDYSVKNEERYYPTENIDYNPDDILDSLPKNTSFTTKPENADQIIDQISKDLDSKKVCEYSRSILKKYSIVDTRLKAIEYYYDSSTDIFYFSYVINEPIVHVIGWPYYKNQNIEDMIILNENVVQKIRENLVKFSSPKQEELVLSKLLLYLKK